MESIFRRGRRLLEMDLTSSLAKPGVDKVEERHENTDDNLSKSTGEPAIGRREGLPERLDGVEKGRTEESCAHDGQQPQHETHTGNHAQGRAFLGHYAALQAEGMLAPDKGDTRQSVRGERDVEEDGDEQDQDNIIGAAT